MRKQIIRLGLLLLALIMSFTLLVSTAMATESQEIAEPNQVEETVEKSEEDKLLDDMEKIVDEFISALRAAQAGDMAGMALHAQAAQQFAEVMQKVNLAEAEGRLSEAQIERGKQIAQKIEDAVK